MKLHSIPSMRSLLSATEFRQQWRSKISTSLSENAFDMSQFSDSVNAFLAFRNYKILKGKGSVSKAEADAKAEGEYDIFNKTQPIISDFDKEIKRLKGE